MNGPQRRLPIRLVNRVNSSLPPERREGARIEATKLKTAFERVGAT